VDTGERVEKFIESLLKHKKMPTTTTFEQLFEKTKKRLRIWATDIQSLEPVEFSLEKTPTTEITTALRASIAYPLYFTPVKDEQTGHLLIDGGVMDNYPISMLTEKEAEETLGAAFIYENKVKEITNVLDVFRRTLSGFYRPTYQALLKRHLDKTVLIPCLEFPELHFQATLEERQEIIDIAAKTTRSFLQKSAKPLYQRRNSVS
jgi:predicted acylesterase/phospholipase RssA